MKSCTDYQKYAEQCLETADTADPATRQTLHRVETFGLSSPPKLLLKQMIMFRRAT